MVTPRKQWPIDSAHRRDEAAMQCVRVIRLARKLLSNGTLTTFEQVQITAQILDAAHSAAAQLKAAGAPIDIE